MLKSLTTGLCAAVVALVASVGPAVAQENFTLRPMLVADIGRDVESLRGPSSYSSAKIVDTGIRPKIPEIAQLAGAAGDVIVRIEMTAEGKLTGAGIAYRAAIIPSTPTR